MNQKLERLKDQGMADMAKELADTVNIILGFLEVYRRMLEIKVTGVKLEGK